MSININGNKFRSSIIETVLEKDLNHCRQKLQEYKPLLHSITNSLGLNEKESQKLVEGACLIGEQSYAYQKENLTLKTWLAKILVHNCIFKINSKMFSQGGNAVEYFQTSNNYSIASLVSKIPISFRIVYILLHSLGFSESEAAQILNITPRQVRERCTKAMIIIRKQ